MHLDLNSDEVSLLFNFPLRKFLFKVHLSLHHPQMLEKKIKRFSSERIVLRDTVNILN